MVSLLISVDMSGTKCSLAPVWGIRSPYLALYLPISLRSVYMSRVTVCWTQGWMKPDTSSHEIHTSFFYSHEWKWDLNDHHCTPHKTIGAKAEEAIPLVYSLKNNSGSIATVRMLVMLYLIKFFYRLWSCESLTNSTVSDSSKFILCKTPCTRPWKTSVPGTEEITINSRRLENKTQIWGGPLPNSVSPESSGNEGRGQIWETCIIHAFQCEPNNTKRL